MQTLLRREQILRESEARYRTLFESITEGFCIIERIQDDADQRPDFRFIEANPAFAAQSGIADVIGKTIRQVVPDEANEWIETYDTVLHSRKPLRFERELISQGRILEVSAFPTENSNNRVTVIFQDITHRKQIEMALRKSDERYRFLFETMAQGFCVFEMLFDDNGRPVDYRWIETNPAFERHTGLVDAVGKTARELVPGLEQHWVDIYGRVAITGERNWFIQRSEAMDRWFEVDAFRIGAPEECMVALLFTDISERVRAQEAQRESEARYRLLMENVQEYAIFMLDIDGRIATWNTGAQRIIGYTEAEAIGRSGAIIFVEEDRAHGVPQREMETAAREGQALDERWHVRKDGSRFWASGVMTALYHPDGSLRGFAKVLRDNTDRKEMEDHLRRINETLEERVQARTQQVRELAAQLTISEQAERRRISQILHDDLQQRLYSLLFQLAWLPREVNSVDGEEAYERMKEELNHAIDVCRSLSVDLSPPVLSSEGLVEAIRWLAGQMKRQHGLAVEILAAGDTPVPGKDLQELLFQTVRELLFNVVKHAQAAEAAVALARTDGVIRIEVSDQGRGFDVDAVLDDAARGQGLLRTRHRLELVNGSMRIESTPGEQGGTRVIIECPVPDAIG